MEAKVRKMVNSIEKNKDIISVKCGVSHGTDYDKYFAGM